jgi:coiled-coil domain-containing protein 6
MISNTLQKKLTKVLQEKVDLENRLEQEQEAIVNKLGYVLPLSLPPSLPHLTHFQTYIHTRSAEISKLRKEKQDLVMEVEREEELLTNTLSRKLDRERREKHELEAQLLIEQGQVCM